MHTYLRQEAERLGLNIEIHPTTAEHLEFADNSIDAVVSTLVLCSVEDLEGTLQEILRVLKPGGRFYFLEHVAAPQGTWLRRMQQWIRPVWKKLGDGCRPDRETWVALEQAGFEQVEYQRFQAPVPAIVRHQIIGVAMKTKHY
jgi:ubiquinone/menaquinone biosynthesis C-methylase UbiE